jgi:hypothetical protein
MPRIDYFNSTCLTIGNKLKGNLFVCLMVFNATFNNISFILWRSVLLVEETGGPRENHRPDASH